MKKSIRKIFSLFLALVMVFSLLPAQAMAEEPEGSIAPVEDPAPAPEESAEQADEPEASGTIAPVAETEATIEHTGTCGDNLTWTLDSDGVLTVSGTGAMADWTSNTTPWRSYRSSIHSVVIEAGATSIGAYAFSRCTALTSLSAPDTLTGIGNYAFEQCSSLTDITIPSSVTSIGTSAFRDCTSLTAITVDADNTKYASLGGVLFNKAMTTVIVCPEGKSGSYAIPDSVVSVSANAFSRCAKLTKVTVGPNVKTIINQAFYRCTGLTSVTFRGSVGMISSEAFAECSSLKEIFFLGDAPSSINANAFTGVTADVYYPEDNATWTADKLLNYGGTLTWHALDGPVVSPYGLTIAGVPVTDDNKDDVLGDGVFRYDSAAGTLHISGTAEYSCGGDLICNTGGALTITTDGGTANLLAPLGEGSSMIYSTGNLSFSGGSSLILNGSEDNNTFRAGTCGVRLEGASYMTVNTAADIRVYRVEKGFLADGHTDLRAYGCNLYANSSAAGFSGFTRSGVIIGSAWRTPANAVFNGSVYESDGTTLAKVVSLHVIEYDLTIAGRQLDYNTSNGFLGNLMYRYDPSANVLHLQGSYTIPTDYAYRYLISNSIPNLILQIDSNVTFSTELYSGQDITFLSSGKDLTIRGDYPLTIYGSGGASCTGIYCYGALTLDHAQLWMGRDLAYGLDGGLDFTASLNIIESEIELRADTAAVFRFPQGINLTDCCFIRPFSPRIESGIVYPAAGSDYAKRVTIGVGPYPIGIDGVTVTEGNKNDVLGNGVFSFDSDSFTLTVNGSYAGRENAPLIENYIDGLTIVAASPDSCLTMTSTASNLFGVLVSSGDVTILPADATCSLTLRDSGGTGRAGVFMTESSTLTVRDLSLKLEDLGYGLLGSANAAPSLVLDGASLDTTNHVANAGIQGFSGGISLQNCGFVAPAYPKIVDGSVKIETWQSTNGDYDQYVTAVKTAPADQVYDLVVDGTRVWAGNAADVLGNGVFSYDAAARTLTLSGSYSQPVGSLDMLGTYRIRPVIDSAIDGLTVQLTGNVMLSYALENYSSYVPVINSAGSLTLTADSSLNCPELLLKKGSNTSFDGIHITGGALTVENISLNISEIAAAAGTGILGDGSEACSVTFRNACAKVTICEDAALAGFPGGVNLDGSWILAPESYTVSNGTLLDGSGSPATTLEITNAVYDLYVWGRQITGSNLQGLWYRYDPEVNILHLYVSDTVEGASFSGENYPMIENHIPGLILQVEDDLSLSSSGSVGSYGVIETDADMTIRSRNDSTLGLKGNSLINSAGIRVKNGARLTVSQVRLVVVDSAFGLMGEDGAKLEVVDSWIQANDQLTAGISGFTGGVTLSGCELRTPAGGWFLNGAACEADGSTAKSVEIFRPGYDLWIDGSWVSYQNQDDVLGDGTFSYDPSSKTLTIHKSYSSGENGTLIMNQIPGLTVSTPSDVTLTSSYSGGGSVLLYSGKDLKLTGPGRLTLHGPGGNESCGLRLSGDGSTLSLTDAALYAENLAYGVCGVPGSTQTLAMTDSILDASASAAACAYFNGGLNLTNCSVLAPENYRTDEEGTILMQGGQPAIYVIISGVPGYDVWVGGTRVTVQNKDDILGDGSVSYDPDTRTLTFTAETLRLVPRFQTVAGVNFYSLIWSDGDLILQTPGSLTLEEMAPMAAGDNAVSDYVYSGGSLTVNGDFIARSTYQTALYARDGLTVNGSVDVIMDNDNRGSVITGNGVHITGDLRVRAYRDAIVSSANGDIRVDGNVSVKNTKEGGLGLETQFGGSVIVGSGSWEIQASLPIDAISGITIPETHAITKPEGGQVTRLTGTGGRQYYAVTEADGETAAQHVVIEPFVPYALWLGETQVTSTNKADILGDGTASYDPETKTLSFTTSEPNITGLHENALIWADGIDLTIERNGSLSLTGGDDAVRVNNGALQINAEGAASFLGTVYGVNGVTVNAKGDITMTEGFFGSYKGDILVTTETGKISAYRESSNNLVLGGAAGYRAVFTSPTTIEFNKNNTATSYTIIFNGSVELTAPEGIQVLSGGGGYGINAGEEVTVNCENGAVTFNGSVYGQDGVTVNAKGDITMTEGYFSSYKGDILVTTETGKISAYRESADNLVWGGAAGYRAVFTSPTTIEFNKNNTATSYMIIFNGSVELTAPEGIQVLAGGGGYGIYAGEELVLESGGTIELTGTVQAYSGITIPATHSIVTPAGGRITQIDAYYTVTEADGTTVASHVVIRPGYLPGDINGDGVVDNKDVTRLIRYLKYHDVTVVEAALDVNGDGETNNKDVTRLIRYIKYHDVEIH